MISIRRSELSRFLPLFLCGFLICLNYSLLRCLKDTLVVVEAGAALIPFLKMWGVLPAALILAPTLSWLFRRFRRLQVVSFVLGGFLIFFALFATLLPLTFWPICIFYIVAELWKVAVLMVLFWGYVNGTTPLEQAKRFYAPLMLAGSLAGMAGGQLVSWTRGPDWLATFHFHLFIVILAGLITFAMLLWLHHRHPFESHPDARHIALDEATSLPPDEHPRSVWETLRVIFRSRVLLCLALIIFADYVAFNLVEVLWKDQLYRLYPNPMDFCAYTGRVTFWTGALTGLGSLFLAPLALKRWSWTATALVTPVVLLTLSCFFFFFGLNGMLPAAVGVGALHSVLSRTAQWSFGGPTKELAYIPLSPTLQTHGKAFVDGLCPTLGKSTGALTQQGLLMIAPSLAATAPFCACIVIGMLLISMAAAIGAGQTLSSQSFLLDPKDSFQ